MSIKIGIMFMFIMLSVGVMLAWPYQLNLTDGTLYDLNASNNATNNFTIFVVNQTTIINNTYTINQTVVINQTNVTCYNCTYTNVTYSSNITNGSFLTTDDFTTYKTSLVPMVPRAEYNALVARVDGINVSLEGEKSHGGLWGGIIVGWLVFVVAIFLIYKSKREEYVLC